MTTGRPSAAQAAWQAAQAQIASAEAQRDQASKDRARTAQFAQQGAVSRRDLEVAETLENTRQRELEAARQQLAHAQQSAAAAAEEIPRLQAQQRDPDYLLEVYSRAEPSTATADRDRSAKSFRCHCFIRIGDWRVNYFAS